MHLRSTDRPGRLPQKKRRAEPGRWGRWGGGSGARSRRSGRPLRGCFLKCTDSFTCSPHLNSHMLTAQDNTFLSSLLTHQGCFYTGQWGHTRTYTRTHTQDYGRGTGGVLISLAPAVAMYGLSPIRPEEGEQTNSWSCKPMHPNKQCWRDSQKMKDTSL